jgi:hypothetical protein
VQLDEPARLARYRALRRGSRSIEPVNDAIAVAILKAGNRRRKEAIVAGGSALHFPSDYRKRSFPALAAFTGDDDSLSPEEPCIDRICARTEQCKDGCIDQHAHLQRSGSSVRP